MEWEIFRPARGVGPVIWMSVDGLFFTCEYIDPPRPSIRFSRMPWADFASLSGEYWTSVAPRFHSHSGPPPSPTCLYFHCRRGPWGERYRCCRGRPVSTCRPC